tara:strand:+ start:600 stop:1085 length:486 start_codon:yes stop_codon:yes gene_type:complete
VPENNNSKFKLRILALKNVYQIILFHNHYFNSKAKTIEHVNPISLELLFTRIKWILAAEKHQKLSTVEQDLIKATFKKRKNRQIVLAVFLIPIIGFLFSLKRHKDFTLWGIDYDQLGLAALAIIIPAVIFSIVNWRCPNCNKYLGKGINPNHCSKCGANLQ